MNNQPKTPQRIALGRAIEQWEIAKAEVENTVQAAELAATLAARADAKVKELADRDEAEAARRAARIKHMATGKALPSFPDSRLDRIMEKDEAAEDAQEVRKAHARLLKDIKVAEDRVAACAEALHHAIVAVLCSEGDALARELAAVELRASALRQQLIALDCTKAMLPGMAQIGDMQVSTYTGQVLRNPPRLHDLKNPEPALMRAWRDYYLVLSADPAAGPPAADADGQPVAA